MPRQLDWTPKVGALEDQMPPESDRSYHQLDPNMSIVLNLSHVPLLPLL